MYGVSSSVSEYLGAPATTTDGTCPELSGVYRDKGEGVPGQYRVFVPSLSYMLFHHQAPLKSAIRVEIRSLDSNVWRLTSVSDSATVATRDVTAQEPCRMGEAKLADPNEEGWINREGVTGYEWSTMYLSRGSDNSLVLRFAGGGVGFMGIPAAVTSTDWYRFQHENGEAEQGEPNPGPTEIEPNPGLTEIPLRPPKERPSWN